MKHREWRATVLAVALWPVLCIPALAEQLGASQIERLLAGNTIEGAWSGENYRQFFSEDGFTVLVNEEGTRIEGRWRVDQSQDVYESWWRSTGWMPYAVVDVPDGPYAWLNGDRMETFEVEDGRRID